MSDKKYDYVIVGSGAGGATLAKELSSKGKTVAVIEKGKKENKLGGFFDCYRYYDVNRFTMMPPKSKEGVVVWRSFMAGGPTVVCCGNGVRCLEEELAEFGINLEEEFNEAEDEMKITPYDTRRLSSGGKKILEASTDLGYKMEAMPKFIDPKKCRRCGNCQYGCAYGAKWTAVEFLDEAEKNGADIFYNHIVDKVITENGTAKGVSLTKGNISKIDANAVILSAGGLATPVIMQKSGLDKAGSNFFEDMLVNTYGVAKGLDQTNEPTMAIVDHEFHKSEGFILSPFIHQSRPVRYIELGIRGMLMPTEGLLGIMAKTADDSVGRVYPDGSFSKTITDTDRKRLDRGAEVSKEILLKAGADSKSIVHSNISGGHPGGTAAIGEIVDKDLQTEVNNLFACDASVLPKAPGLPPILTIVALAKRLSKMLVTQR
ncbi:GMC family oxidoreductase N-terminal domain-containing protein [Chloroflexota bacterium]